MGHHNMRVAWHCLSCMILFIPIGYARLSNTPLMQSNLEQTQIVNYLEVGYRASFAYDSCGDTASGSAIRQAYRQLIAECPFLSSERGEFQQEALRSEKQFRDYIAHTGHLPDHWGYNEGSCEKYISGTAEIRARLGKFRKGEISAEEAAGVSCNGRVLHD